MADEELNADGAGKQESSGGSTKKVILFVVLGLLVAGGSAGAALFFSGALESEPVAAEEVGEVSEDTGKDAVYVSLNPAFTVNFQEPGKHRFLQIALEAMTRDPAMEDHIRRHSPMIRNKLVLLFGSKTAEDLSSREGKEKLQAETLQALQDILEKEAGAKGVEAVYFTSFVMQ